jgi:hypothetical protein
MPKLNGLQLAQPIKKLSGENVFYEQMPSAEEIQAAEIEGKKFIEAKKIDLTVKDAIIEALTYDLSRKIQTDQGLILIPDPHEEKKFQLWTLANRILKVGATAEDSVLIDSEKESPIIKLRIQKRYGGIEVYGFIYEILEGINTDFSVVSGNVQQ